MLPLPSVRNRFLSWFLIVIAETVLQHMIGGRSPIALDYDRNFLGEDDQKW